MSGSADRAKEASDDMLQHTAAERPGRSMFGGCMMKSRARAEQVAGRCQPRKITPGDVRDPAGIRTTVRASDETRTSMLSLVRDRTSTGTGPLRGPDLYGDRTSTCPDLCVTAPLRGRTSTGTGPLRGPDLYGDRTSTGTGPLRD